MTIEKAMQRLFWRMGNGSFTPNKNDIESLTEVAQWINREKQRELQQNTIFAKLYVYCFIHELHFYKNIDIAQQRIHEILKQNISVRYDDFLKAINNYELDNFRASLGIKDKHPLQRTAEEDLEQSSIIIKNSEMLEKYFLGVWDYTTASESLNNQITEAINHYKNLP